MERDEEHALVLIEDLLRAVAVVHVPVEHLLRARARARVRVRVRVGVRVGVRVRVRVRV